MACGLCRRTARQTEQGCVWEEVHMEGDSLCLPAAVALLRPWLNGSAAICFGPTYRERNCALPISVILVWIWLYKLYLLTTNTLPHWHWCKLGRAPLYAPHSGESRAAAPAKTSDYTNIYLMNKTEGVRWGLAAIKREAETVTSLGLISGRPCGVTSEPPQPVNVCLVSEGSRLNLNLKKAVGVSVWMAAAPDDKVGPCLSACSTGTLTCRYCTVLQSRLISRLMYPSLHSPPLVSVESLEYRLVF